MSGVRRGSAPPALGPVAFRLDERELELPVLPSSWWLGVLPLNPPGCWWFAVPVSLSGGGDQEVLSRLADEEDPLDLDDVERLAERVVSSALGVDLWAGHRLAAMAYGNWINFDSWCASSGFDPFSQPIGRVLSAVYAWRSGMCQKRSELEKLDREVWAPPPMQMASGRLRDQAPRDWTDERESAAFAAALELSS